MQVWPIQPYNNPVQAKEISFKSIVIVDPALRSRVLKSLKQEELSSLKDILVKQKERPVDAFIGSNKLRLLTANLYCPYRLKNFKEYYRQLPLVESKFDFIQRIAQKCDEYRAQIV